MSDPLMEALFIGAGAFIGSKLGRKYLGPEGEKPVWNGHINNDPSQPAVIIGQVFHHGKTWYRLYIAAEGDCALVGESGLCRGPGADTELGRLYRQRRHAERLAIAERDARCGDGMDGRRHAG
jgi:hypothetical protein